MSDPDFHVAEFVARARKGDQDAASVLYQYLSPVVRSIVRRKLPRGTAAEDLVQEIFSKVFEKLDQYGGEFPLRHWVSRIAVNHCLNAIRFQKAHPEWRMADLSEAEESTLQRATVAGEQTLPGHALASKELVENILGALSPEDRRLIRKLDVEESSIAEVQQATGWSPAYIRMRAFRARRRLNKRFASAAREVSWQRITHSMLGPARSSESRKSKPAIP